MHLLTTAVQRSGWLPAAQAAAAAIVAIALLAAPVAAQEAGAAAPVAKPKAPATSTAPATQSAEETLWQEILSLRQLPSAPAGSTQPLENQDFVRILTQQLNKSLQATDEYLKKYPNSDHAEEVQIQRLDTMRLLAVANKQPLDAFQAEAQKVVKSNVPVNVKAAAEYMLMGIRMDDYAQELLKDQLTADQREQAWRQAVTQRAKDFIAKYPKTAFAERFYVLLIDSALQQGDLAEARATLEQLRQNHPQSPFIAEITSAIQEAAATQSQPASTEPAASEPAGKRAGAPGTMPKPVSVPHPTTRPAGN